MKRINQAPSGNRVEVVNLPDPNQRGQLVAPTQRSNRKHLLLRHPNFVAKSKGASFEPRPLACEASALTTELTAPNHSYPVPKLCQKSTKARGLFPAFNEEKLTPLASLLVGLYTIGILMVNLSE